MARRWKCGRLLNLGCGHGADFLPFKDGFESSGLDISSEMLKYARKFAHKHSLTINLRQGDMRALPYPTPTSITPSRLPVCTILKERRTSVRRFSN